MVGRRRIKHSEGDQDCPRFQPRYHAAPAGAAHCRAGQQRERCCRVNRQQKHGRGRRAHCTACGGVRGARRGRRCFRLVRVPIMDRLVCFCTYPFIILVALLLFLFPDGWLALALRYRCRNNSVLLRRRSYTRHGQWNTAPGRYFPPPPVSVPWQAPWLAGGVALFALARTSSRTL
jgi:hypothetical protein